MPSKSQYKLPKTFYVYFNGIDAEHEELVDMVNQLSDLMREDGKHRLDKEFERFFACMAAHFEHEEVHMRSLDYQGLDWHREHHRQCLSRTRELLNNYHREDGVDPSIVDQCFTEIITDIASADLKFAEFLESKGLQDKAV